MAKLILMFKDKILNAYPLVEGARLTIGRHPDNDIVIDNLSVSGHHAHIDHQGGEIVLTDLKSKNGTLRNGTAVTQCVIADKDTIAVGKHFLQADLTETMAVERDAASQDPLPSMDSDRTMIMQSPVHKKSASSGYLSFLSGGQGELSLANQQISIGKNGDADIVIKGIWALLAGGPSAVITKQAGEYYLRYAGGWVKPKRNGSMVKGTVKLSHADVVAVGPVKVQIKFGERPAA